MRAHDKIHFWNTTRVAKISGIADQGSINVFYIFHLCHRLQVDIGKKEQIVFFLVYGATGGATEKRQSLAKSLVPRAGQGKTGEPGASGG